MTPEKTSPKKPPFFPKKKDPVKEPENTETETKPAEEPKKVEQPVKKELNGPEKKEEPMSKPKKEQPAGTKKYKFMFQTPGDKPMTISFKDGTQMRVKYGDLCDLTPEQYKRFDYWFKETKD